MLKAAHLTTNVYVDILDRPYEADRTALSRHEISQNQKLEIKILSWPWKINIASRIWQVYFEKRCRVRLHSRGLDPLLPKNAPSEHDGNGLVQLPADQFSIFNFFPFLYEIAAPSH